MLTNKKNRILNNGFINRPYLWLYLSNEEFMVCANYKIDHYGDAFTLPEKYNKNVLKKLVSEYTTSSELGLNKWAHNIINISHYISTSYIKDHMLIDFDSNEIEKLYIDISIFLFRLHMGPHKYTYEDKKRKIEIMTHLKNILYKDDPQYLAQESREIHNFRFMFENDKIGSYLTSFDSIIQLYRNSPLNTDISAVQKKLNKIMPELITVILDFIKPFTLRKGNKISLQDCLHIIETIIFYVHSWALIMHTNCTELHTFARTRLYLINKEDDTEQLEKIMGDILPPYTASFYYLMKKNKWLPAEGRPEENDIRELYKTLLYTRKNDEIPLSFEEMFNLVYNSKDKILHNKHLSDVNKCNDILKEAEPATLPLRGEAYWIRKNLENAAELFIKEQITNRIYMRHFVSIITHMLYVHDPISWEYDESYKNTLLPTPTNFLYTLVYQRSDKSVSYIDGEFFKFEFFYESVTKIPYYHGWLTSKIKKDPLFILDWELELFVPRFYCFLHEFSEIMFPFTRKQNDPNDPLNSYKNTDLIKDPFLLFYSYFYTYSVLLKNIKDVKVTPIVQDKIRNITKPIFQILVNNYLKGIDETASQITNHQKHNVAYEEKIKLLSIFQGLFVDPKDMDYKNMTIRGKSSPHYTTAFSTYSLDLPLYSRKPKPRYEYASLPFFEMCKMIPIDEVFDPSDKYDPQRTFDKLKDYATFCTYKFYEMIPKIYFVNLDIEEVLNKDLPRALKDFKEKNKDPYPETENNDDLIALNYWTNKFKCFADYPGLFPSRTGYIIGFYELYFYCWVLSEAYEYLAPFQNNYKHFLQLQASILWTINVAKLQYEEVVKTNYLAYANIRIDNLINKEIIHHIPFNDRKETIRKRTYLQKDQNASETNENAKINIDAYISMLVDLILEEYYYKIRMLYDSSRAIILTDALLDKISTKLLHLVSEVFEVIFPKTYNKYLIEKITSIEDTFYKKIKPYLNMTLDIFNSETDFEHFVNGAYLLYVDSVKIHVSGKDKMFDAVSVDFVGGLERQTPTKYINPYKKL